MILPLLTSLLVASASAPTATLWDDVQKDIDAWNREASIMDTDLQSEEQDALFHSAVDLFPAVGAGAASSAGSSIPTSIAKPSGLVIHVDGASVTLQDVPVDAWYAFAVRTMAEKSMISGYRDSAGKPTGFFGPGDSVTVAQLAKVLTQAADISEESCPTEPLNRSATGHWSASYVSCAEKEAWSLFTDASMNVERPATRAEVVGTLLQALRIKPASSFVTPFTDVRTTTAYADAIAQAHKDKIINGYKDAQGNLLHRFGPFDPVTRAEFAKIVVGGLEAYDK